VGSFPGHSWREWNGRFRDDVRSFFRGDEDTVGRIAECVIGSPQIYRHKAREPEQSVNFVTCHDGFTLNDLVSFNQKHNEQNGDGGRDGTDDNRSENYGAEGPSTDPAIESIRSRQIRNHLTVTILSLGFPMLLMGDEMRRTQRGNNNAWCHDGEISWLDWGLLSRYAGLHRFVRLVNRHRSMRIDHTADSRITLSEILRRGRGSWHGIKRDKPDWGRGSHSIALHTICPDDQLSFYMILNAYWEALEFELPPITVGHSAWRRWIDTNLDSPEDIVDWSLSPEIQSDNYIVGPRSVIVLFSSPSRF
jgi:glycogen operon protein